jgi:hypothetical protein
MGKWGKKGEMSDRRRGGGGGGGGEVDWRWFGKCGERNWGRMERGKGEGEGAQVTRGTTKRRRGANPLRRAASPDHAHAAVADDGARVHAREMAALAPMPLYPSPEHDNSCQDAVN